MKYIFLADTAGTVWIAQEQGGYAGRCYLPSGQSIGGRSGDVCMDKKVLLEFLNPDCGQGKGWILILQL